MNNKTSTAGADVGSGSREEIHVSGASPNSDPPFPLRCFLIDRSETVLRPGRDGSAIAQYYKTRALNAVEGFEAMWQGGTRGGSKDIYQSASSIDTLSLAAAASTHIAIPIGGGGPPPLSIMPRTCNQEIVQAQEAAEQQTSESLLGQNWILDASTSNQRTYRELVADQSQFSYHWEQYVVPDLLQKLVQHSEGGFSVNVFEGDIGQKKIIIMSAVGLDSMSKQSLLTGIRDALPQKFRNNISLHFYQGTVRVAGAKNDEVCPVRNWFWFPQPMMGDSAGVDGIHDGGTLGPRLQINGQGYWLINCHILDKHPAGLKTSEINTPLVKLMQPSLRDYGKCWKEFPGLPPPNVIGQLVAYSGEPYRTTRVSRRPFFDAAHSVVTDWALFRADNLIKNSMRKVVGEVVTSVEDICQASDVIPSRIVNSSGRTSGFQEGRVSLVPAIVYGFSRGTVSLPNGKPGFSSGNCTGVVTREWSIAKLERQNSNTWMTGGIGVPGDSGAGVVDAENNTFYGQVWGRNEYSDLNHDYCSPRIAYFTSFFDICDDIEERSGLGRPVLPTEESIKTTLPVRSSAGQDEEYSTLPAAIRKMFGFMSISLGGPVKPVSTLLVAA